MSRNIIIVITSIVLAAGFSACSSSEEESSAHVQGDTAHNSMNALDWDGTYRGILPCADCEGVLTAIELDSDLTYTIRRLYLGKESREIFVSDGSFSWQEDGNSITLDDIEEGTAAPFYRVGENRIIQLDLDGNRITGDLADQYVLIKAANEPADMYWILTEVYGEEVVVDESRMREPYMILYATDSRVAGNSSCNSFSGSFELDDGNRLRFSGIVSTRMACENMEIETRLFEAFENADNYTLGDDGTLSINRARMAPLARFTPIFPG